MIRQRIRFTGDVQGVGFRWRARMAAQSLGITGWVSNEWDGSVLMEVQGTRTEIERMIAEVDSGSFIRITGIERQELPVEVGEYGFRVR